MGGEVYRGSMGEHQSRPERDRSQALEVAMRELADWHVVEGFEDRGTMIEVVAEAFNGEGTIEHRRRLALSVVEAAGLKAAVERAKWPAETDCDRLDRAFVALSKAGLLAFQHYWCCDACAAEAIMGDYAQRLEGGELAKPRGFVFYHAEETERATTEGILYLSYGSDLDLEDGASDGREGPALEIAAEAVKALAKAGLSVSWDGEYESQIEVELDWKRRAPPAGWVGWRR